MAADHDPTTGLLVSMHGAGLYNDRYGTFRLAERNLQRRRASALVDEFLAEQALFQQSLAERALRPRAAQPRHHRSARLVQLPAACKSGIGLQLQFAWRLAADGEIGPLPVPRRLDRHVLRDHERRRPDDRARSVPVRHRAA